MTPTQPTAEQLRLAQECACQAVEVYGEGDAREHDAAVLRTLWNDHPAVQSALLAIQATEARMAAAVEADVEKVARIIDPSSWAVMDGYLSDMLRKYKGQKIGYDPDAFKHKPSMKIAEKVIAAIRSQSNG